MKMSLQKRIFLEHSILPEFCDFGSILGWPGGSTNHQKFVKSNPGDVKSGPRASLGPLRDMARTFGAIWKHVLMILNEFWKQIWSFFGELGRRNHD